MPKSSSFGAPSAVTRMFAGFRSRCTTRFWCAYWTAPQISRNSCSRSRSAELLAIAVAIERLAVHVLHHEVGIAFLGFARVDQARDVRVIQAREDLALGAEAQAELALHRAVVDDLDCDLRRVLPIGALAEVHRAGAAVAEDRNELVVAEDAADERLAAVACRGVESSAECKRERAGARAAVIAGQQLEQLGAHLRVVGGFSASTNALRSGPLNSTARENSCCSRSQRSSELLPVLSALMTLRVRGSVTGGFL